MTRLFLTNRFFYLFGAIALCFAAGFLWYPAYIAAQVILILAAVVFTADIILLFNKNTSVTAQRISPKIYSLNDVNTIQLTIENTADRTLYLKIIDELPVQFQKRDFEIFLNIPAGEKRPLTYSLTPKERGLYAFGNIQIFASTALGLAQRQFTIEARENVPVYPSIIQMKNLELKAFKRLTTQKGIKKIRRIGHSYEFDQIKNYTPGDDMRSINWKATGRRNELMVNQYEDERSQQIYCIIETSRAMKMPFDQLSLLDYAVNAGLAISNIALRKYDKAGLITFANVMGAMIKADRKAGQLNQLLQELYKVKEFPLEANYELLYHTIRRLVPHRSLLLLFTNYESMYSLDRVLPVLRRLNRFHLLVVLFFENTEIKDFAEKQVRSLEGIYTQAVAQKFIFEKNQMVQKLEQYGIQSILTRPEDLSINTINKYLELKARGLI